MKRRSFTVKMRDIDENKIIETVNVRACNETKAVEFWKRDHYWVLNSELISVKEERL